MYTKRLLLVVVAVMWCSTNTTHAQSIWKYFSRPDFGVDGFFYKIDETGQGPGVDYNSTLLILHWGMSAGFNLPFYQLGEHWSLGINPNVGIGIGSSQYDWAGNSGTASLSLEVPVFVTMKLGTDATWLGSKTAVGGTVGIGYQYSDFISLSGSTSYDYALPTFMLEVNFGVRRTSPGLIKIRYTANLGSYVYRDEYDDGEAFVEDRFHQSAVHLIFTPAY